MRILKLLLVGATTLLAADWGEATGALMPGQRIEVQHKGKIDRGLYALSNKDEIVITKAGGGSVSIPQAEVNRIVRQGVDSPALGYFANARDQLCPKPEIVYERSGAAPAAKPEKKRHWWATQ